MLTSDKLKGLRLEIRYDYMDRLAYLLGHFEPATTICSIRRATTFSTTGRPASASRKRSRELRPLPPIFTGNCRSRITVPRSTLLNHLGQLESISSSDRYRDFLVTLRGSIDFG